MFAGVFVAAGCGSGDGRDLPEADPAAVAATPAPTTTSVSTTHPGLIGSTVPNSSATTAVPPTVDVPSSITGSIDPTSGSAPTTGPSTSDAGPAPDDTVPEGFDAVRATVTTADGEVCELCVWLAATPDQRSQGLMGVTHLGDADAMAFRYDEPTTTSFWMMNTVLPLSIAFFGADGAFLDAFDMDPCESDPCPRYPTPSDFVVAVEFERGTADDFGVGPGSVLALSDLPCDG